MNNESNAASSVSSGAAEAIRRSLLGSKSLWTAILVTILGAASWGYAVVTKPNTPPQAPAASMLAGTESAEPPKSERLLDKSAPRTVRYGLSFIAAFLVAYAVKKVIKSVLIVAGLVIAAIVAIKYLGIFEYDWSSAQQQVEQGVEFAKQETGRLAKVATEFLPSSVSAGVGAIFGARRG